MKRTISVILTVFLLATAVFALVACGGVETETDWNNAVQTLKDSKSITVKMVEKVYHNAIRLEKKKVTKLTYNAKKGELAYYYDDISYTIFGLKDGAKHIYKYFKVEGSDLKCYTKEFFDTSNYSNDEGWVVSTIHFDSKEAALQDLHETYLWLLPVKTYSIDFSIYDSHGTFGKLQKTSKDDYYDYTHQLQFSNGKLTKIYDAQEVNSSLGGKTEKNTTTIKYSAIVTAPKGIGSATEVTNEKN